MVSAEGRKDSHFDWHVFGMLWFNHHLESARRVLSQNGNPVVSTNFRQVEGHPKWFVVSNTLVLFAIFAKSVPSKCFFQTRPLKDVSGLMMVVFTCFVMSIYWGHSTQTPVLGKVVSEKEIIGSILPSIWNRVPSISGVPFQEIPLGSRLLPFTAERPLDFSVLFCSTVIQ